MKLNLRAAGFLSLLLCCLPASAETEAQRDERMGWFREARFGMFIHWGLYSILAGEWNGDTKHAEWIRHTAKIPLEEYNKLLLQFNPTNFDAQAWARSAKRAGMKYMVITSKHHDGFCLWDSKLTDFDVMSTPFKRDILRELKRACDREGIRFCTYHSIMDWHHPDYLPRRPWEAASRPEEGASFDRFQTYLRGQLREIVRGYRPGILWFDGEWEPTWTHEMGAETYDYVRALDPRIIVNNRVDKGRRGMQGMNKEGEFKGDYGTPEQEIPPTGVPGLDWESCMTMNDHWGWNKADKNWKSTEDLVRKLIDIASKGGNFLLNIGPKPDGTFPEEAIERLEGIGKWMDKNDVAIYGTTASPLKNLPWGRCTQRASWNTTRLFLHVFNWPADGQLLVPGLMNSRARARVLASGQALTIGYSPEGMTITLPEEAPDPISSTIVVDLDDHPVIKAQEPLSPNADGSIVLSAANAEFYGESIRFEEGEQRNCIGFWTNPAEFVTWQVQMIKPGTYEVVLEHAGTEPSSVVLTAGDASVSLSLPATGDYGKFERSTPQRLTLKEGTQEFKLAAVEKGWKPVNIRSIKLVPR